MPDDVREVMAPYMILFFSAASANDIMWLAVFG
jgi:hypothetical protein